MKKFLLFFVFIVSHSYSQSFVQWRDGRKSMIIEESFSVQPKNKRILFTQNDSLVVKLKYKDLDSVVVGNFRFLVSKIDGKLRGNYKLASSSTKHLLAIGSVKSRPAGGFERLYTQYEVYIVSNINNGIIFKSSFSNENTSAQIASRKETMQIINDNFKDCSKLLARISAIEAVVKDTDRVIEELIKIPVFVLCD